MTLPIGPEWRWLLKEVRPVVRYQLASVSCVIAASAVGLTGPLLMKWLIDDVLPNRRWGALALATAAYWLAAVGRVGLQSAGTFINTLGVRRMTFRIRQRLTTHVQMLPAAFHTRQPVGDLVQRLERDVSYVGDLGSEVLPSIIRVTTGAAMTIGAMIYLDWRITAIVLPLLPILAFVKRRSKITLQRDADGVREAVGHESNLLVEMLTGAIDLQLLGAEHRLLRRYARLGLRTMQRQLAQRKHELLFRLASVSIIGLGSSLIVGYGGIRVVSGTLTIGGLVAFYGYIGTLFTPMNTAVDVYSRLHRILASIRRLIDIEQVEGAIVDAPDALPLAAAPRRLAVRNVSFAYNGEPVLRGLNFDARVGERVALIGESGCGKSSLLKLIPRLYAPGAGRLLLDGQDVRALPLRSLRAAISFVPQEPMLFHGTLRDNLRYAAPCATAQDIARATEIACLTDVIARLPGGWNFEVGPKGSGLSGGEKQRVAIARALLQDRPILILDEASSALDSVTEHELLARLEDWAADRLVIFATHRVAAYRWANRVIVLSHGAIVEDGRHELLNRPGTYYDALCQPMAQRSTP